MCAEGGGERERACSTKRAKLRRVKATFPELEQLGILLYRGEKAGIESSSPRFEDPGRVSLPCRSVYALLFVQFCREMCLIWSLFGAFAGSRVWMGRLRLGRGKLGSLCVLLVPIGLLMIPLFEFGLRCRFW